MLNVERVQMDTQKQNENFNRPLSEFNDARRVRRSFRVQFLMSFF